MGETSKSKTLSFEPPLISFYNKNHPRVARKEKLKVTSGFLNEEEPVSSQPARHERKMSKIELICEEKVEKLADGQSLMNQPINSPKHPSNK